MNFKDATTEQLRAEIQRREREEEERLRRLAEERHKRLVVLFQENPGIVDVLAPEHGRASCDDKNLSNGDPDHPRCNRCVLMRFMENPRPYEGVELYLPNLIL